MKDSESLTISVTPEEREAWKIKGLRSEVVYVVQVAKAAGFHRVDCVGASIEPEGVLYHFEVTS